MPLIPQFIRSIAAVSIWMVLFLLAPLSTPMNVVAAVLVLGLVSLVSGLAVVLAVGRQSSGFGDSIQIRSAATNVSLAISIWWAMIHGGNDPLMLILLTMIACLANSVVWPIVFSVETVNAVSAPFVPVPAMTFTESAVELHTTSSASERLELRLHEAYSREFDQPASEDSEPSSDERIQWFTRSITPEGEVIEGGFRIDFAEGQRDVTVHVSFCPPLATVPEIATEDLDGHDLEIRAAAIFPYGARLTVRRSAGKELAHADSCCIGYVAFSATIRQVA